MACQQPASGNSHRFHTLLQHPRRGILLAVLYTFMPRHNTAPLLYHVL